MSAHVLFNLLNELGKVIKCEAYRAFYYFFATSLINSIIQRVHECHMPLKSIKKSHFWRDNVKIVPSFTQRYNGRHNVSRKSVIH